MVKQQTTNLTPFSSAPSSVTPSPAAVSNSNQNQTTKPLPPNHSQQQSSKQTPQKTQSQQQQHHEQYQQQQKLQQQPQVQQNQQQVQKNQQQQQQQQTQQKPQIRQTQVHRHQHMLATPSPNLTTNTSSQSTLSQGQPQYFHQQQNQHIQVQQGGVSHVPPLNNPPQRNNPNASSQPVKYDEMDASNKRFAKKGQWQTPPMPVFASQPPPSTITSTTTSMGIGKPPHPPAPNTIAAPAGNTTNTPNNIDPMNIQVPDPSSLGLAMPNSSDDYARALQEAYRAGAVAAAKLSRGVGVSGGASVGNINLPPYAMSFNTTTPHNATAAAATNASAGIPPHPIATQNAPTQQQQQQHVVGVDPGNLSSLASVSMTNNTTTPITTMNTNNALANTNTNVAPMNMNLIQTPPNTGIPANSANSIVINNKHSQQQQQHQQSQQPIPMNTKVANPLAPQTTNNPPSNTTQMAGNNAHGPNTLGGVPNPISFFNSTPQQPQPPKDQQQQHALQAHVHVNVNQPKQQQVHPIHSVSIPTSALSNVQHHGVSNHQQAGGHTQQPSDLQQMNNTNVQSFTSNAMGGGSSIGMEKSRSISLPDINSYEENAGVEEAKRIKRLARNRASARLRRLRKKNLVDSYEGEVGVLETSLSKLRAHKWGVGADPEALLEALSMDRGQQTIDAEKRKELVSSILDQQREQVRNVMECQMENIVLGWIARQDNDTSNTNKSNQMVNPLTEGKVKIEEQQQDNNNSQLELISLSNELNNLLQLSPEQKKQLCAATEGVEEEMKAIETVETCLKAMSSNTWLMNEGVEECTDQFTSILSGSQMSKFLLWADHNSEAIDTLDYVNAPPANSAPASLPMFVFGIDDGPQGDDVEEAKFNL